MKTLIRWFFSSLVTLAISGCLVEGGKDVGASDVKITAERNEKQSSDDKTFVVWAETEEGNNVHDDLLFIVWLNEERRSLSIRAIKWSNLRKKFVGYKKDDCVDHYPHAMRLENKGAVLYSRTKYKRTLKLFVKPNSTQLDFSIPDQDGNMVHYYSKESRNFTEDQREDIKRIADGADLSHLLDARKCDDVSRSDPYGEIAH